MRHLLFLSLLVLPLLFLGCDEQTPAEPDSDATFAKATMTLNLHAYCVTCTQDGNTFYTGETYRSFYYFACPAEKGAIRLYRCMDRAGFYVPAAECAGGTGRWTSHPFKKVLPADPCNSSIAAFYGNVDGTSQGWKLTYSPRGSGYYKAEFIWDVNKAFGPS